MSYTIKGLGKTSFIFSSSRTCPFSVPSLIRSKVWKLITLMR